ncbi:MAG: hypothetical protein ABI251_14240 [Mycobacteriaceae bacterium]
MALLPLLIWLAAILGFYWLIRLAVRHGVQDAQRRTEKPSRDTTV